MRQSLGAVIDFLMAQPNWSAADSALLVKLGEALADVEKGHNTSWLSSKPTHRPFTPVNIRRRQAQAAAHMEQLMRRGLSREEAAKKVFREIPCNSLLFIGGVLAFFARRDEWVPLRGIAFHEGIFLGRFGTIEAFLKPLKCRRAAVQGNPQCGAFGVHLKVIYRSKS